MRLCRSARRGSRSARGGPHGGGGGPARVAARSPDQWRYPGACGPPRRRTGRQRCRRCPARPGPRRRPGARRPEASAGGPDRRRAPSFPSPSGTRHVRAHRRSRWARMKSAVVPAPAATRRRRLSPHGASEPCASPRRREVPHGPPLSVALRRFEDRGAGARSHVRKLADGTAVLAVLASTHRASAVSASRQKGKSALRPGGLLSRASRRIAWLVHATLSQVSRALFLAVVLSVAALVAAPSASASFSGQNGRIVFTRELFRASGAQTGDECDADPSACGPDEPRRSALGVVRPNGLDRARLPTCRIVARCEDSDGAFSPDGRRIAFERGGRLFVARADGTRVRRISTTFAG